MGIIIYYITKQLETVLHCQLNVNALQNGATVRMLCIKGQHVFGTRTETH